MKGKKNNLLSGIHNKQKVITNKIDPYKFSWHVLIFDINKTGGVKNVVKTKDKIWGKQKVKGRHSKLKRTTYSHIEVKLVNILQLKLFKNKTERPKQGNQENLKRT